LPQWEGDDAGRAAGGGARRGRQGPEDAGDHRRRQVRVARPRRLGAGRREIAWRRVVRDPDRSVRDDRARRTMTRDWRLPICAVLSLIGHIALARGLSHLPAHQNPKGQRRVSIRVIAPPPPEEPPPEPVRAPEPPPKVPHERPRARVAPIATDAPPP